MGSTGVVRGEVGIVTTNLGAGRGCIGEEKQVVNRDQLCRTTSRDEERVRGVNHIARSGQPLDGRPGRAMPERIQDADRNPAIDYAGSEFRR